MSLLPDSASSSKLQMDYMKLLTTQLKNQNPMEPMDNKDMTAQLATFAQLSQLESMNNKLGSLDGSLNTSFSEALNAANKAYANSLLDKKVTFFTQDENTGQRVQNSGTVTSVFNDPEKNQLLVGVQADGQEYTMDLGSIVLVENQG